MRPQHTPLSQREGNHLPLTTGNSLARSLASRRIRLRPGSGRDSITGPANSLMERLNVAVLWLALASAALTACGRVAETPGKLPLRLVMSSQVYALLPVVVAESLGYYEAEGLAVEIQNVESNTMAVHALSGGSADVATGPLTQVLSVISAGRDLKAFSAMLMGSQIVMIAPPGTGRKVRAIEDLRGAPIGVGGFGGPTNIALNWFLRSTASDLQMSALSVLGQWRRLSPPLSTAKWRPPLLTTSST
jgi:hypothetical protein